MAALKGYCAGCPCWFPIADASLHANRLCPCCLQPATKVRRASAAMVQPRFISRLLPWRRTPNQAGEAPET
jgi:hypothetical protein